MAALKTRLQSLPLNDGGELIDGGLFELVAYYDSGQMDKALHDLMANHLQRVAFIIPSGQRYQNERDRLQLHSRRFTGIDLILSDRDYDPARSEALVGGDRNVGVLELEHRVVTNLVSVPLVDLPDVQFEPEDSSPIELSRDANERGRLAIAISLSTRAGLLQVAIP